MKRNLIVVPFASIENFETGVNLKSSDSCNVYMKNACVACLSAKKNTNDDIMFVSNLEISQKYSSILRNAGVKIYYCNYDDFKFQQDYKWSLAFYKLCALKRVIECFEYRNYALIDTDVYVQSNFDKIWDECCQKIVMYNISTGHINWETEYRKFGINCPDIVPHYGGEFFAANRENAGRFIRASKNIYEKMMRIGFRTNFGDEFISSLAAYYLDKGGEGIVGDANAVCRCWTRRYRRIPVSYKDVPCLHVPSEKEYGMLEIFKTISQGKFLPPRKVYRKLHLSKDYILINIYRKFEKILKFFRKQF